MVVFLLKSVIFTQAKCVGIFSADRFFYGLTASQSTLLRNWSIMCYTLPELLYFYLVLQQSLRRLRRAITIIIFHKIYLLMIFIPHYNWKGSDQNFDVFKKFIEVPQVVAKCNGDFTTCFIFFLIHSKRLPQVKSLHINKDAKIQKFGVYRKIFLPYTPRTRK